MPIHIRAEKGQVADFVITPGEAARAKFIAETYLEDVRCYTEYRHLLGYTGKYKGVEVSVQTTGMGVPSSQIVFEELAMLGAKYIVRIGTCGGLQPYLKLGGSIVAMSAWGCRPTIQKIVENDQYSPIADVPISNQLFHEIEKHQTSYLGPIITADLFYSNLARDLHPLTKLGCLAVEMEAAGLFALGAKYKLKTSCILTVSDLVYSADLIRADDDVILEGVKKNAQAILEIFHKIKNK